MAVERWCEAIGKQIGDSAMLGRRSKSKYEVSTLAGGITDFRPLINAADVTDGDSFVTYLKVSTTAVPFEWENEARNAEEGLWSLPNPKEPWIWKKENPNFHEAVPGVRVKFTTLCEKYVVVISCVILVGLFSLQHHGTHRVVFLFAPIVTTWLLCISGIGVYNIFQWNLSIFRALSPFYMYRFLQSTRTEGWVSLGGVVLCITGVETIFADLGHFSPFSIKIAFTFLVYPSIKCLMLAYIGEAAFLSKHHQDIQQSFYKAMPEPVFWPVFVVATLASIVGSQAVISATFSIKSIGYSCLCLAVTVGLRDTNMIGRAYGAVTVVMFVTSYLMFLVIIIVWKQRIMVAVTFLVFFGSIELFYISASRTKVLVFVCVKSIQVPYVCEQERFLIGRIGPKEYGMLRHIVRYGYKDLQQENYNFENRLVSGITEFVETEGAESTSGLNTRPFSGSLSSDGEENQRCLSDFKEVTSDGLEIVENSIHRDVSLEIMRARESGVTYIIGNSHAKAKTSASILKKLAINIVYDFLGKNCRGPDVVLNVPPTSLLEVGSRSSSDCDSIAGEEDEEMEGRQTIVVFKLLGMSFGSNEAEIVNRVIVLEELEEKGERIGEPGEATS
ncbi:hypothetical protein AAC387_Pa01g0604 [Persea americana]